MMALLTADHLHQRSRLLLPVAVFTCRQTPANAVIPILRLESHRQHCMVIGEDLGIVSEEVRRYLSESGIYSKVLFYLEKSLPTQFRSQQDYPERGLAMLANHDIPTLAAWWSCGYFDLRFALGLTNSPELLRAQKQQRHQEQLLESQWLLPANRFSAERAELPPDYDLAAASISFAAKFRNTSRLCPATMCTVRITATCSPIMLILTPT